MRAQIVIIGGGPSGLLLGQLLHRSGVDTVILERKSREHVLSRIRAGVLEQGMAALMEEAGVGARMRREGFTHEGALIAYPGGVFRIDFKALTGKGVMVYGQTELTRDLYEAREATGAPLIFNAEDVAIDGADGDAPGVSYRIGDQTRRIACDFIAGCDGFHGVSRQAIPQAARREYEKIYPFGWLGILSNTPPINDELVYVNSERGFALCSMRNANLSRYYIQQPLSEQPQNWSDDAFWNELRRRLPPQTAEALITGPSIEKSIAPLRSFVCEPMRWGRLFLCGDAAHIVPPTGAKGLNSAASDVHYLYHALRQYYQTGAREGIEAYSARALARVWKTQRFSWWFTALMHQIKDQSSFDRRLQRAELAFLQESEAAQKALAENYVGPPY